MKMPILWKTMRDLRWQVIGYGLGLALLAALDVSIYPSYSNQLKDFEIPDALKGFIGDSSFTTPKGFLSAEFFSFAPAVLCIFAIMAGTSALAGEEANGNLELLLAQPMSRARLVAEKLGGLILSTVLILAVTCLGWLVSVPFVNIDISIIDLLWATLTIAPLVLAFEAISMWAAAVIPDRKLATGLLTLLAIVSYMVAYLASVVDVLQPLRWVSLFHYEDGTNALTHGGHLAGYAVLLVIAAAFTGLTFHAFGRREIGVNAGPSIRLPFTRKPETQSS